MYNCAYLTISFSIKEDKPKVLEHCKLGRIRHILKHDSLLQDVMESTTLGKTTNGQKDLQMLSNTTSKDYATVKTGPEDRSS